MVLKLHPKKEAAIKFVLNGMRGKNFPEMISRVERVGKKAMRNPLVHFNTETVDLSNFQNLVKKLRETGYSVTWSPNAEASKLLCINHGNRPVSLLTPSRVELGRTLSPSERKRLLLDLITIARIKPPKRPKS
ncbi:hypothetical protein HY991_00660 [Candidatus Micrarchaeota archaeon]|nr:hypothetical protein [Candidatus Micrarchaeota archaeon]